MMAKFTGYTSDITGKRIDGEHFQITVQLDSEMGPAGSMERVYETYDLTSDDVKKLLGKLQANDPETLNSCIISLKEKAK